MLQTRIDELSDQLNNVKSLDNEAVQDQFSQLATLPRKVDRLQLSVTKTENRVEDILLQLNQTTSRLSLMEDLSKSLHDEFE